MRRVLVLALVLMLLPLASAQGAETMQITDLVGRKVTVPVDPQRIVCLGPGCLRLVTYLKGLDKVVGVEKMERRSGGRPYYLAHKKTIDGLPVVSPGGPAAINKKPDLEAILKVGPQVVFVTYMKAGLANQVQALLNLPVVVLTYGRLGAFDPAIYKSLRLVGRVLNRTDRAESVISYIEAGRADLLARVKNLGSAERPRAYVGGIGFKGSHGIESTDTLYLPFAWLKVDNAAADPSKPGHLMMDKEKLLALQPATIFIDAGGLQLVKDDYGKKKAYYQALKAFNQGRVKILFPFNWYATNIGTALADAYAIGAVLWPDRFKDIDPAAKADAIYTELVGRPVYRGMVELYGPLGGKPGFIN